MNNTLIRHGVRILLLLLIQGVILERMELTGVPWKYIAVIVYPVSIMLLPRNIPMPIVLLVSFFVGLAVDMFYHSPGVHASALLFMAMLRPLVFNILEPRGGYSQDIAPSKEQLGFAWFLRYSAIMLGAYLFFYFSVEAFSFVFIGDILLNTILSFLVSFLMIQLYVFLFNPK